MEPIDDRHDLQQQQERDEAEDYLPMDGDNSEPEDRSES